MKKLLLTAVVALMAVTAVFARKNAEILLVTGGHDFEEKEFFAMFDDMEGVKYTHAVQPRVQELFNPEGLGKYDVIVFYDMWQDITEEAKNGLLEAVGNGQPILVFHHAICAYDNWPEYINLAGGKYFHKPTPNPDTGEMLGVSRFKHDVGIELSAVKGNGVLKMVPVTYPEERYYNVFVKPGVKPLLMCRETESGEEAVMAWEHKYGKGTVISFLTGHDHVFYNNNELSSVLRQTIEYLAKKK